jgi:hypothetical protein
MVTLVTVSVEDVTTCLCERRRQVTAFLNQRFENRWIGRRGPIPWPPRSPDLTPLNSLLWCLMKEMTYMTRVHRREELWYRIMEGGAYIREPQNDLTCSKLLFGMSKVVH